MARFLSLITAALFSDVATVVLLAHQLATRRLLFIDESFATQARRQSQRRQATELPHRMQRGMIRAHR